MKGISSINVLNEHIYNLLKSDEWLIKNNVQVYQSVEKDNAFPYISMGESTGVVNTGSTYWDETLILTLHVYSQSNSKYEANEIINRLLFLLQEKFVFEHYIVTHVLPVNKDLQDDIDQFTKHGVVQMKYKIKNKVLYREE